MRSRRSISSSAAAVGGIAGLEASAFDLRAVAEQVASEKEAQVCQHRRIQLSSVREALADLLMATASRLRSIAFLPQEEAREEAVRWGLEQMAALGVAADVTVAQEGLVIHLLLARRKGRTAATVRLLPSAEQAEAVARHRKAATVREEARAPSAVEMEERASRRRLRVRLSFTLAAVVEQPQVIALRLTLTVRAQEA